MKPHAITLACVLAVTMTACGSGDPDSPTPTVAETATAPASQEAPPAGDLESEEATPSEEAAPGIAKFGDAVTLPNGEGTIIVTAPEPYKPSETAFMAGDWDEWDEYVVMTVTEKNDGKEPALAGWSITATTGDAEAEQVFDSANGVDSPTADVMPGKSITYKIAFGRKKGQDFVLQAAPLAGLSKAYYQ